jgi:dihydrolipoamide dehydrogenase
MHNYDAIVIGTGRGLSVAGSAAEEGLKVAVVDKGPPGGTCLNTGCIPSKFLISAADRVMEIEESPAFRITAGVEEIDFGSVMKSMRSYVSRYREERRRALSGEELIDYYPLPAEFTGPRTLRVGDEEIEGDLIFVAAGARPAVPPIEGLEETEYLTNETLLELEFLPRSLIMIGGGYIGVEYAHFFSALGVEVTLVDLGDRLVGNEEPEISELLGECLGERLELHLGLRPVKAAGESGNVTLTCERSGDGGEFALRAEALMVATGRRPNSDRLRVEAAGVETDGRGFIQVGPYYRTSGEGVWAFGDIIGKAMFTHAGSREASLAWNNARRGARDTMNYEAVPHAVFTRPQIASVGMTEARAGEDRDILVGRAHYRDVVKGAALRQSKAFAKAVVEAGSRKLLGIHLIGPYAPILIQEITQVIAVGGTVDDVNRGLHIHPALGELIPAALRNLEQL